MMQDNTRENQKRFIYITFFLCLFIGAKILNANFYLDASPKKFFSPNEQVNQLFQVKYNTSNPDTFGYMELRRTFSDDNDEKGQRIKVLIAQYDFGNFNNSYAEIIAITSKINKAYAHKYNHDYLLARGIFIEVEDHPDFAKGKVAAGSTSNKVGILEYALQHPDKDWDYVLVIDADAMVCDFERDIGLIYNMTHESLIAHRVLKATGEKSFDINAGVILWNLKHPQTQQIVKQWDGMIHEVFRKRVGEDQEALHKVLHRIPARQRPVRAIRHDFQYSEGTVVKHFIRPGSKHLRKNWDDTKLQTGDRVRNIRETADEICKKHEKDCDGVTAE